MSIYSGNKKVSAIYRGSTPITKVYRGTIQVFPDGGVPDPDDYNIIGDFEGENTPVYWDWRINNESVKLRPVVKGKNSYKLSDFYDKEITSLYNMLHDIWVYPFENVIFQNVDVSKVTDAGYIINGGLFPEKLTMRNLNFESLINLDENESYEIFNVTYNSTYNRYLTLTLENVKLPLFRCSDSFFGGSGLKEIHMKNVTLSPDFYYNHMFSNTTNLSKLVADKYIMDAINNNSNKAGLASQWDSIEKYYYDGMGNEQPYVG